MMMLFSTVGLCRFFISFRFNPALLPDPALQRLVVPGAFLGFPGCLKLRKAVRIDECTHI